MKQVSPQYGGIMFIAGVALIVFDALALDAARKLVSRTGDCGSNIVVSPDSTIEATDAIKFFADTLVSGSKTLRLLLIMAVVFTCLTFVKYVFKGVHAPTNEFLETSRGQKLMFLVVTACVVVHVLLAGAFCTPFFGDLFGRLETDWTTVQQISAGETLLLPGSCDLGLFKKLRLLTWLAFSAIMTSTVFGHMLIKRDAEPAEDEARFYTRTRC